MLFSSFVSLLKNKQVMKYVAYYRVSTARQGKSGLGLEAQKVDVQRFVNGLNGCILSEFTDVESGKKANRAELLKAIALCKATGATLIIAKLDRLSRDVEFIFALRNSGVDFKACDLPDFNTLTLGMFAVIAQHEREIISNRVTKCLNVKKERGEKLGSPIASETLKKVRHLGTEANSMNAKTNENNIKAMSLISLLREKGLSYAKIAKELNAKGFKTRNGKEFTPMQVQRLFERATQ